MTANTFKEKHEIAAVFGDSIESTHPERSELIAICCRQWEFIDGEPRTRDITPQIKVRIRELTNMSIALRALASTSLGLLEVYETPCPILDQSFLNHEPITQISWYENTPWHLPPVDLSNIRYVGMTAGPYTNRNLLIALAAGRYTLDTLHIKSTTPIPLMIDAGSWAEINDIQHELLNNVFTPGVRKFMEPSQRAIRHIIIGSGTFTSIRRITLDDLYHLGVLTLNGCHTECICPEQSFALKEQPTKEPDVKAH